MPRTQQLILATGALWATANAAGIRTHGDVPLTTSATRRLQTSLPDGVVTSDLGCCRDGRSDRVLEQELMDQTDLTPDTCALHCYSEGYQFYGLQYGQECWCGVAGTDYDRLGSLDMSECAYPCTGDASSTCGGYLAFQAFELGSQNQPTTAPPTGYLGCYADDRSRIFSALHVTLTDNNAESCKASCVGYAYYGLQYGEQCFCGTADEDYTVYGESDNCVLSCTGDASSTCGGSWAMDVYAMDDDLTDPPATAPPTTDPPATAVSSGYLGCYADTRTSRIFSAPIIADADNNSAETCKATCVGYAYYGLQYALQCFCGTADEDYTLHGESNNCLYPCTGDASSTCGGAWAMDVYVMGDDVTAPPATAPPTTAPPVAVDGDVLVDLVPCLFSSVAVEKSNENNPALYIMSLFFKGYWSPRTEEYVVSETDDLTALLVDSSDTTPHGKCNAVYVGYAPSTDQVAALTAYSAQFKVRLVYFPSALTHTTAEFTTKLGIQTYFAGDIVTPAFVQLSDLGSTKVSITQPGFKTDPNLFTPALFSYPVIMNEVPETGIEVLAQYADSAGEPYLSGAAGDQENAAILSYTGADGHEELHVFNTIGWFDAGAWPWAHFYNEWATKGIFMGERRFYLAAVVDDLFLSTPEFEYDGDMNEAAVAQRCTGEDLTNLLSVQQALNTQYSGSDIITEFAFNGGGIAEHVSQAVDGITYVPDYEETMVTIKGTKWYEDGQINVHDTNWLATNVPLMQQDMADGTWEANDELLVAVISYLDTPSTIYHGHHTLIHLSRDQLRETDCVADDTAAQNLMVCYPGDNTFDGTVSGATILVNEDNQFHSIYSTVANNGYDGIQIVPRFATYVYFNCVTGSCLVNENEYIRRFVCECTPLDPSIADYSCASTADECIGTDGATDIQSFGDIEALFDAEASTTTRYMLTGRRDKYMFHQANIIPAGDVGDGTQSLLDYWYERVLEVYSSYITFPVKNIKFDDLCTEFKLHEALDDSSPYVTMALDATGAVTGFNYVSGSGAGLVPLTVPTASAASIPTTGLSIQDSETYGTDTTYYLKDDDASTIPRVGTKPDASATQSPAEIVANAEELAENQEANALVPAEHSDLLADQGLVDADVAADVAITAAEEEGLL
ncbi:conserved unknown protein [Ectocarpus siliculosus]|uniref:WSC domain-containing protein n=1 Tax=Ectocarpus siliculosus TaxID=2880 RepID=D7FLI8_ECTSI|nr:conserved unknown protein [Ectocarpus siliculosus]|eukprot:CBJ25804.1 conserved unknown protein [Ectocarpus siliculosus]